MRADLVTAVFGPAVWIGLAFGRPACRPPPGHADVAGCSGIGNSVSTAQPCRGGKVPVSSEWLPPINDRQPPEALDFEDLGGPLQLLESHFQSCIGQGPEVRPLERLECRPKLAHEDPVPPEPPGSPWRDGVRQVALDPGISRRPYRPRSHELVAFSLGDTWSHTPNVTEKLADGKTNQLVWEAGADVSVMEVQRPTAHRAEASRSHRYCRLKTRSPPIRVSTTGLWPGR